jgi:hypothetical protein
VEEGPLRTRWRAEDARCEGMALANWPAFCVLFVFAQLSVESATVAALSPTKQQHNMRGAGSKASGSGQAQRSGMDEPDAFQAAAEASGGGPVSSGGSGRQQPTSSAAGSGEQQRTRSKKSQRKSHGQGATAADAATSAAMTSPPPAAPAASAAAAAPSLLDESDPFFSSYAALEMRITQCSHLLAQILRTLKHIKAYPHDATRYTQSMSDPTDLCAQTRRGADGPDPLT